MTVLPENEPCTAVDSASYTLVTRDRREDIDAKIIDEQLFTIYVNGQELTTMMCTPCSQEALALGFLANEGVVDSLDGVQSWRLCSMGRSIDIWLNAPTTKPLRRVILTSGSGGSITFDDLIAAHDPVEEEREVTPDQLWALMDRLYQQAHLHQNAGGVHVTGLSDGEKLVLTVEDAGRHNTFDKLRGLALMNEIETAGGIILTTGRISSEIVNKARGMDIPVVCSKASPTNFSIRLAARWNMTLIGCVDENSMRVYTHPRRVDEEHSRG
jgi:FdhD protein